MCADDENSGDRAGARDAALFVRPVTEQALILCLSGRLDVESTDALGSAIDEHLKRAAEAGRRLVLDLTNVTTLSAAAVRTLDLHTRHLTDEPALSVTGTAPLVHEILDLIPTPGLRAYETLDAALSTLPFSTATGTGADPETGTGTETGAGAETGAGTETGAETGTETGTETRAQTELRTELFGMRAKARTAAVIGLAQGIVTERYGLSDPATGFALLRDASQRYNVPIRILASAVVTAPAPPPSSPPTAWFPGRLDTPAPHLELLGAGEPEARNRSRVLRAVVYQAVTLTDADAVEVHLTDRALDNALILEAHEGLDAAYRDTLAEVTGLPALCARARVLGVTALIVDIGESPDFAASREGRAALALGTRTLQAFPCLNAEGECTATITIHRRQPNSPLSATQRTALETLASDLAAWRSWYRRTVVLDALSHLHNEASLPCARVPRGVTRPDPDTHPGGG